MPVARISGLYLREARILAGKHLTSKEILQRLRESKPAVIDFAIAMVDGVQQPNELEIY